MRRVPEPLPFDWSMRTVDSARITVEEADDGRFVQTVEHAVIPGVTAAMVLWYLERVDQEVAWRGRRALAYRLWHPVDHIHFARRGAFGPGDEWHIVEAFGANPHYWMEALFHVTKLDETGFTMEIRKFGRPVAVMDEQWEATPDGLQWTVSQTIGTTGPLLGPVSRAIRRRRAPMLAAWPRHNVEEVGNLEHFLPALHAELT